MINGIEQITLHLEDKEWPLEYIDHDRYTARAIVYDTDGYFYFVRVSRDDDFDNVTVIETAGGGVERGEDMDTAICRELKEELGADVEIICRLGTVDDYYNVIHRHNINNYYLCRAVSFGDRHLTDTEQNSFHMTTLRLTYEEAVKEYERGLCSRFGRLVGNRELPILKLAKSVLDSIK